MLRCAFAALLMYYESLTSLEFKFLGVPALRLAFDTWEKSDSKRPCCLEPAALSRGLLQGTGTDWAR